eukprot:TRINITY_DN2736_c0_g1_i1.p1 TRINITY_DN2736_c0_g1~~TRINITY_DN2736_c0_g1_i1.p1  ORF type:complete len:611 (-),score=94.69 TRINITY_DN2736_c0_g1_i1:26-1858(-)
MSSAHDTVAVVDFGGQYAHLIATKLRRIGVYAIITDPADPLSTYDGCKGVVLSGGPGLISKGEYTESEWNQSIFDLPVPVLGLCFGHQAMVTYYGGKVAHRQREYGPAQLIRVQESPIFKSLGEVEQVFMSHGDTVVELPAGFVELAYSKIGEGNNHNAAVANEKLKRYGFQYHPEVDDSTNGHVMLRNFVLDICECKPSWNMNRFLEDQVVKIREKCGDKGVFLLASGGVDSTVCAWLLHKALGPEKLFLLHIDNGFMRLNESKEVVEAFRQFDVSRHVTFVDATETFLSRIGEEISPERKRLIIGNTFIDVFQEEAKKIASQGLLLAQGTIYPDTIESGGTKRSQVIKTHHNRVPIIQEMIDKGLVIEPLVELYKVEVRELGHALGIPEHFISRHPFPGPGLGVRLLCSDGKAPEGYNSADILSHAQPIATRYGFSVLPLPIKSVGVKADVRCYESPLLLFRKEWDWSGACQCASEIFKTTPGVNRCIVSLKTEQDSHAHTLKRATTRSRLDTLKKADDIVMRGLQRHGLYHEIWQCPTVLVPVQIGDAEGELVVIRPVKSERAMTAMPGDLPAALLSELTRDILAIGGISCVALDVTCKPPGTIEWE